MARPLNVLLAASLLVNVFAAGAIGGGLLMLAKPGILRSVTPPAPRPIRVAGDAMSPPDRARFRQAMQQVIRENRDLPRAARESRQAAAQLFVQPRFDEAAVAAALERARSADVTLRTRLEAAALDFAATLPLEERTLLAQGLEHGGPLRHPAQAVPAAAAKVP
jgi:uncharacterized membrane protein